VRFGLPAGEFENSSLKKPGGLTRLKDPGLPTAEIVGVKAIKVVSRLLDQLRSRVVVEGAKGQSRSFFN